MIQSLSQGIKLSKCVRVINMLSLVWILQESLLVNVKNLPHYWSVDLQLSTRFLDMNHYKTSVADYLLQLNRSQTYHHSHDLHKFYLHIACLVNHTAVSFMEVKTLPPHLPFLSPAVILQLDM